MDQRDLSAKYVDQLIDFVTKSNERFHTGSYLFAGVSLILYFFTASQTNQIELFGATVPIPRELVMIAAPVILGAILFYMSCFAGLENQAEQELHRIVRAAEGNSGRYEEWQLHFFGAPAYYVYGSFRDHFDTPTIFRKSHTIFGFIFITLYVPLGPAIVAYFIYIGARTLASPLLVFPYALAAFLTFFGTIQYFETMKPIPRVKPPAN
jgi:hypothetical protein